MSLVNKIKLLLLLEELATDAFYFDDHTFAGRVTARHDAVGRRWW